MIKQLSVLALLAPLVSAAPAPTGVKVLVEFVNASPTSRPATTQPQGTRMEVLAIPQSPFNATCKLDGHEVKVSGDLQPLANRRYRIKLTVSDDREVTVSGSKPGQKGHDVMAVSTSYELPANEPKVISGLKSGKGNEGTKIVLTLVE